MPRQMPVLAQGQESMQTPDAPQNQATGDCPESCDIPTIVVTAYHGYFHNDLVDQIQQQLVPFAVGGLVLRNATLCYNGDCAKPDLFYRSVSSGKGIAVEVKTGMDSKFTDAQLALYSAMAAGGQVTASTLLMQQSESNLVSQLDRYTGTFTINAMREAFQISIAS
jgi:hypothetical protein